MQNEQSFTVCFMKYSREYIIKNAFDVFISKGYDSTSISVLQQELKMSRGAMYRYFKNKEDLFFAVIDRYFFRLFEKALKGLDQDFTVLELIDEICRRQKSSIRFFYKARITHTVFLNYTALIIQAAKHYPNFIAKYKEIHNGSILIWKKALQKSIENNEIRSDVNIKILCKLFNSASIRESSELESGDQCMLDYNFAEATLLDIKAKRETMLYLYSLIKN